MESLRGGAQLGEITLKAIDLAVDQRIVLELAEVRKACGDTLKALHVVVQRITGTWETRRFVIKARRGKKDRVLGRELGKGVNGGGVCCVPTSELAGDDAIVFELAGAPEEGVLAMGVTVED